MRVKITGHKTTEALARATVVLPISVGQDYHEGEVFAETLRQIASSFDHVVIVIADTLQRHSLTVKGTPQSAAREVALENGRTWQIKNQASLDALPHGFYTLQTWDEWLSKPGFAAKKANVDQKYIDDITFSSSVTGAMNEHKKTHHAKVRAAKKQNINVDFLYREYVLEEAAVIALWIEAGYNYMAYPVGCNQVNKLIFDCMSTMYTESIQLLDIEIEHDPVTSTTIVQNELTPEQQERLKELEDMITAPFLTQLFTMSRGHALLEDELKIALILSIEEKVKLTCTSLREKMSARQLAENGSIQKKSIKEQRGVSPVSDARMFKSISNESGKPTTSAPASPSRDLTQTPKRRHSDTNENRVTLPSPPPSPLQLQLFTGGISAGITANPRNGSILGTTP